jgi:hypothetical protein
MRAIALSATKTSLNVILEVFFERVGVVMAANLLLMISDDQSQRRETPGRIWCGHFSR